MNRNYILPFCLAASLLMSGCLDKKNAPAGSEQQIPPPQVAVVIAKPENITITTKLPGRLEAYRQAEVRARVPGIVMERTYEEGQQVEEGTTLFKIDPAPYKAAYNIAKASLARANANLESAKDRVERYSKLVKHGAVSERAHTEALIEEMTAKAEVESAIAELERVDLQLGYATVTAPISGRARRALVTEGALVGQDIPTPLTTVEQIDPIYVKFSQPASEINELRRARIEGEWKGVNPEDVNVHFVFPDGHQYSIDGKFVFADMAVNMTTDTIEMRALFPNPKFELLPGAYGYISFNMAIQENVIKVPRDAVLRSEHGPMVLTVNEDNVVSFKPVTTDRLDGKNWLVTKGLEAGDKIIVDQTMKIAGLVGAAQTTGKPVNVVITSILGLDGKPVEKTAKADSDVPADTAPAREPASTETIKEGN